MIVVFFLRIQGQLCEFTNAQEIIIITILRYNPQPEQPSLYNPKKQLS